MFERLRVHSVICHQLFIYQAALSKKHQRLVWLKGKALTPVLSPEDVKARYREVQKGGLHCRRAEGAIGDTTKRLVATRVIYWIIYAYIPCRTKKGYFIWKRGPERSRPMTHDELVNSKYREMLHVHRLHNVRLKPNEVIQAMAEEGASK